MKKFPFIFDKKNKKADGFKILKVFNKLSPSKSSCIVVFGGDGFMLKKFKKILQI